MDSNEYKVTEEQMLNALREGIKATIARSDDESQTDTSELIELLRDYKDSHPDAEMYIETKYGIMTQTLSKCEICSSNGTDIVFVWR